MMYDLISEVSLFGCFSHIARWFCFFMQCVDDLLAAIHARSTECKYDNVLVDYVYA